MDNFKQQEGFTLVEILVAIAIMMIVVFSFTLLFTSSFTWIFDAGDKSEALFKAQEKMDNKIAGGIITTDGEPMVVEFLYESVTVHGETKEVDHPYEERNITLNYYLPENH